LCTLLRIIGYAVPLSYNCFDFIIVFMSRTEAMVLADAHIIAKAMTSLQIWLCLSRHQMT
jgi:hypothetical protein